MSVLQNFGQDQQNKNNNDNLASPESTQVSFVRSQLILFQSRKKFGLLYCLATVAGLFCIPGALSAMASETEILKLIQAIVPLPLISLLVAVGMYILNDLVDADLDRANRKNRPIPSGLVSKKQAWSFIVLTNGTGVLLSIITFNLSSMIIVMPMLAIGILYSVPKIALMNRFVIKNMAIASFYMLCALLGITSSYGIDLAFGNPVAPLHAMAMFGIMIFVGSIVNDLGDVKGDREAGRRTIPAVMGGKSTIKLLVILVLCMPAISWILYGLMAVVTASTSAAADTATAGSSKSTSIGIGTAVATSILALLALARMSKMQKGLEDTEFVRMQHKKWFPLHMVLQSGLVIGVLLA